MTRQNHNTPDDLSEPPLPVGDGVYSPALFQTRAERVAEIAALAPSSFRNWRRPRRPSLHDLIAAYGPSTASGVTSITVDGATVRFGESEQSDTDREIAEFRKRHHGYA